MDDRLIDELERFSQQLWAWGQAYPENIFPDAKAGDIDRDADKLYTPHEVQLLMQRAACGLGRHIIACLMRDTDRLRRIIDRMIEHDTSGGSGLTERELADMMRDPRYWRDRDPRLIEQVQAGFRALYPAGNEA